MGSPLRWFVETLLRTWGPRRPRIVVFIRLFLFEPFRIPSGSMVPTLLIGDHVLVTKFAYGVWLPLKSIGVPFTSFGLDDIGLDLPNIELINTADPQRGDIIVFHYPMDEDVTYIKRVIGVPGDTIRVQDNQVVLNGELMTVTDLGEFDDIDQGCRPRRARYFKENLKRTRRRGARGTASSPTAATAARSRTTARSRCRRTRCS
jgi:signal peptidase I